MTSRERLQATLNHQQPDQVCVDLGSTAVTGIHVSTVSRLRRKVLGDQEHRVKVIEPYQMLGEIDPALQEALGVDVVGVLGPKNIFGFANRDWKPLDLFDGTKALVPGDFQITSDANGDWLIYPEGDRSAGPSGRMPRGGYFFDTIIRQDTIDEDRLDPCDNLEEFGPLSVSDLQHFRSGADAAQASGRGAILSVPGTAFGDIALVPGPWMKHPKGVRDVTEWYISTALRRDYVYKVFDAQCEIALKNLAELAATVGGKVDVAFVTGTDFGTQRGLFISPLVYRDLYKPFHRRVNDFIHRHTTWKTFIHSCGSIYELMPDLIEAGFDVFNPVQASAEGMSPKRLKQEFGRHVTFWGGGVDTQRTLPFGTPEEVYREVRQRIDIFNDGGGFVFNSVHNVQANVPLENVLAMFRAIDDARKAD